MCWKNNCWQQNYISYETYLIWKIAVLIRWEKSLFFNSSFKIWITEELFCFFYLSFYQLFIFSNRFFLFFNLWYIKLTFSVVFEKFFESFICYKFSSVCDLIDLLLSVWIIINRTKWFKYQFYRGLFFICNHIFGISTLLVQFNLKI